MRRVPPLVFVALTLIFAGGLLASLVQRSGGDIELRSLRFPGAGGLTMGGLLYVPRNATAQNPAPGVLAIHGYINSHEMQSPYAIELARRGYVVLALDQTGHGDSSPPAFANGFGGPDGLAFLRTLDIVDKQQIVLEGHSMGGWASLIAAGSLPDGYRSIAISGSSTGTFGAPDGSATFPRNLGLVFAKFDEFSALMWGSPIAAEVPAGDKLKKLFATDKTVEPGRLYGSIEQGTARKLAMPSQIHPANHITSAGVEPVIDWIQQTTRAPKPLPPDDQTWHWKELGTTLSLAGALMLLFALGGFLLEQPFFSALRAAPAEARGARGAVRWLTIALTVLVPVLTYFPLQEQAGKLLKPSALLSQNLTTGLMAWALGTGLLSLLGFWLWHATQGRSGGASALHYGLVARDGADTRRLILRAFGFAFVLVATLYLLLLLCDLAFQSDFRCWVVAARPLSGLKFAIALSYLVPFTAYFVLLGAVLHGQLRAPAQSASLASDMLRSALLCGGGFVLLLLVQYVPLLSGGTLAFPEQHLLTILALQLVVVLPLVGALSSYFFHKTGSVYAGAFVNGLLVTWLLVGGQATHHPF